MTTRQKNSKVNILPFEYIRSDEGEANLSNDSSIKFLAQCIVFQQRAGFGHVIDLRRATCSICKSCGYNTGFGYFKFLCGAELMTDGDESIPCPDADQ